MKTVFACRVPVRLQMQRQMEVEVVGGEADGLLHNGHPPYI